MFIYVKYFLAVFTFNPIYSYVFKLVIPDVFEQADPKVCFILNAIISFCKLRQCERNFLQVVSVFSSFQVNPISKTQNHNQYKIIAQKLVFNYCKLIILIRISIQNSKLLAELQISCDDIPFLIF